MRSAVRTIVWIGLGVLISSSGAWAMDADALGGDSGESRLVKESWVYREGRLTRMDPEERSRLLGAPDLRRPALDAEVSDYRPPRRPEAAEPHFDWRDRDGVNWMTPVYDQGGCGACAAFASLGSLEATVRIVRDDPVYPIDLSEQHVFSCANGDCPTGLYMGDAFDYLRDHGTPDEECFPYSASDDNCDETCPDWQSRVTRIDSWDLLWEWTVDETVLKDCIATHPVACYLEVYNDFWGYSSGVYRWDGESSLAGGHFVVLVGWDDGDNCWIAKNSWDKGWGENGYFYIGRGEVQIATWAMMCHWTEPPPGTPTPVPTSTPTRTPTATRTPAPTATLTPVPELGVTLVMPAAHIRSGDPFWLEARLGNPGPSRSGLPLVVMLDYEGQYWFWPSWAAYPPGFDHRPVDLPGGGTFETIIPNLTWPGGVGEADGLRFWGALLDESMASILGELDSLTWSYGV